MKRREKQLIWLGALMFVVVLAVLVVPAVTGYYQQGREDIAQM